MPCYEFYLTQFATGNIPPESFFAYASRAEHEINRLERIYTVTGTDTQRNLAVCAVADLLYYFDTLSCNGATLKSVSVGSVSESYSDVDMSVKAQRKEIYKTVSLYLDIYRGVKNRG